VETGEEEGEGAEEEEDDGFGTMHISTQRLPTEDNALTRFLRRAIANNGEVGVCTCTCVCTCVCVCVRVCVYG
jgi:hypothetical protein